MKKLTLVLESALEAIPNKLWKHPAIKRYSEKRGKPLKVVDLFNDHGFRFRARLLLNLLRSSRIIYKVC